jgi:putative protease
MEKKFAPELLMPAGNLEKLKTGLLYGADAVYAGAPDFSLRTTAETSVEDLQTGAKLLHEAGKKLYLTLNVYSHNSDFEKIGDTLKTLRQINPDGLIISDPGIFDFVAENYPEVERHISTQASTCSYRSVQFWEKLGASLVVLGRETTFAETQEIIQKCPNTRIEMFVHGAMCMSYSGRCLLSSFMTGRSANRGACAQPCRWKYKLHDVKVSGLMVEEQRPDEYFPIEEDEHGSYIMSSRDLCLMEELPQILDAGVASLKVEGRNKSEYYVACATRAYAQAIKDWQNDPHNWDAKIYSAELNKLENRGYTKGFFYGTPDNSAQNYDSPRSDSEWRNIGVVRGIKNDAVVMEMRNTLDVGEEIEFLSPTQFTPIKIKMDKLLDARNGLPIERASAGHEKSILIPLSEFEKLGVNASEVLPTLTIARKLA